jgi:hypothetical protein
MRLKLQPLFAPMILANRSLCAALAGLAVLLVGAQVLHISLWKCPCWVVFHIPCPGCGLTRAMQALVCGNPGLAWQFHPLAPVFLLTGVLLLARLAMPAAPAAMMIRWMTMIEERTGAAWLVLIAMVLLWAWRLGSDPHGFIHRLENSSPAATPGAMATPGNRAKLTSGRISLLETGRSHRPTGSHA